MAAGTPPRQHQRPVALTRPSRGDASQMAACPAGMLRKGRLGQSPNPADLERDEPHPDPPHLQVQQMERENRVA